MTMPIHLPRTPAGVERDDVIQGRIYYTRMLLKEYGHACALAMLTYQSKPTARDVDLDALKRMFGMTI